MSAGNFALSGREGSPRGTLYAVYVFLEWLGVRWWAPDETFYPACPSADKFTWAAEEQWYTDQAAGAAGASPVAVRAPGTWTSTHNPLWALRMRINGDVNHTDSRLQRKHLHALIHIESFLKVTEGTIGRLSPRRAMAVRSSSGH